MRVHLSRKQSKEMKMKGKRSRVKENDFSTFSRVKDYAIILRLSSVRKNRCFRHHHHHS
jgi:hypothetical protein